MSGKGSGRRPSSTDPEIETLRWALAFGDIDAAEKERIKKRIQELERREH